MIYYFTFRFNSYTSLSR